MPRFVFTQFENAIVIFFIYNNKIFLLLLKYILNNTRLASCNTISNKSQKYPANSDKN